MRDRVFNALCIILALCGFAHASGVGGGSGGGFSGSYTGKTGTSGLGGSLSIGNGTGATGGGVSLSGGDGPSGLGGAVTIASGKSSAGYSTISIVAGNMEVDVRDSGTITEFDIGGSQVSISAIDSGSHHGSWRPTGNTQYLGDSNQGWNALFLDYTNTATVGAVVMNKASGRVNIGAGASSVVVTNNLVTAKSHVFAVCSTNDTLAQVKNVVPAAGSFTINLVASNLQTSIDFLVIGAD